MTSASMVNRFCRTLGLELQLINEILYALLTELGQYKKYCMCWATGYSEPDVDGRF